MIIIRAKTARNYFVIFSPTRYNRMLLHYRPGKSGGGGGNNNNNKKITIITMITIEDRAGELNVFYGKKKNCKKMYPDALGNSNFATSRARVRPY